MKKLFSFLLALCMTISLAACGQQVGSGGTSSTAGSGASGSTQGGSDWPTRPVNITVAASAGGATDILVRMYAEKFQEVTGQPLVVTNISGASAYVTASTASPDGYNFGTMSTAFLTYKHQGMVDFTWDEGYEMAAMVGTSALIGFVVPSDSPYETINDLVDAAKANPGTITVGNGQGTPYYWQLAFQKATNTDFYTVHLGDTNELNVALLGGQVDVVVSRYTAVKPYLESGDFRMLCIAAEERSESAPDIPTCLESSIDFTFSPEFVVFVAPKETPVEALEGMNKVMAEIHSDEEFMAEIMALGQEVTQEYSIEELNSFMENAQAEIMDVIALAES